jgi:hypothetical protein
MDTVAGQRALAVLALRASQRVSSLPGDAGLEDFFWPPAGLQGRML